METKYSEKLSRYIIIILTVVLVGGVCWYLRSVISYIILAALVAVLAGPVCNLVCRIHIKDKYCPRWLGSIVSLLLVFSIVAGIIFTVFPLIGAMGHDISIANIGNLTQSLSDPLTNLNRRLIRAFPKLGRTFRIENSIFEYLQSIFDVSTFSSIVGSVTSFIVNLGITLFSMVFISFFFIKTPGLATSIVSALVPDKYEEKTRKALHESGILVSRYFIGMAIEVLGVSFLNFLGLLLIARMGARYSIGIAFLTGILNVVPYIGPIIGGVLGVLMSLVIKYACFTQVGIEVGFFAFVLILAAIFVFTQLVDNYVYQPLIYSNSVKAHPLEIFIVFLVAGHVGGAAGMLVAVPAYTVLRVLAKEFLGDVKAVKRLTS